MTFIFCSVSLSGCASFDVTSDYDASYNYQKLIKYAWLPGLKVELGEGRIDDRTAEIRIKNAVETELVGKGFKKVSNGEEDFLLGFNVALNEPLQRDKLYEFSARDYGSFTVAYEIKSAYQHPTFDVGSLVLDVIIPDTNEIIWRGSVQTEIHLAYTSSQDRKKKVAKAVHKLLNDFPPNI